MSRARQSGSRRSKAGTAQKSPTLALLLGGRRRREDKGKAREEGRKREAQRRSRARPSQSRR